MEVDSECSPPPSLSLLLKIMPFESLMYVLMTVLYSPFPQNRLHVDEEHADVLNVTILGKNLEWHFLMGHLSYSKSLKYFPCKLLRTVAGQVDG